MNDCMIELLRRFKLFVFIVLLAGVWSCNELFDDIKNAKIDFVSEFGMRMANVSLYVDKAIQIDVNTFIEGMPKPFIELLPGEDGILKLRMTQKYNKLTLDSILNLKDSVFTDSIGFPAIYDFFVEGSLSFGFQLSTFGGESLSGKQIDSLKLDSGILRLEFNTYDQFDSEFNITFPGIVDEKNNSVKIKSFTPTAKNNIIELDLTDHKIQVLRRKNKEYFMINLDFYIESLEDDIDIDPKIKFTLEKMDLDYVFGSFGYDTIPGFSHQEIVMPGNIIDGQDVVLDFLRPEIKFHTLNTFELPFRYDIQKAVMKYADGHTENVTGIPNQIFINAPTAEESLGYVSSEIAIDPATNIDVLISKGPDLLVIGGQLWTNPGNPKQKNYIRDDDSLSAILDIDLPFEMRITEIVIRDTSYAAVFEDMQAANLNTKQLKIKTDVSNSFPFELSLQSYFYSERGVLIDSLFTEAVNVKGSEKGDKTIKASYYSDKDELQLDKLNATRKTITVARFKTANAQKEKIVSFRNEHRLDIKLTAFTKINVHSANKN